MIRILHLFPQELGLNGEGGNVAVCNQRLDWAGISAEVVAYESGPLPDSISAVMIGSGTFAGAMAALSKLESISKSLMDLKLANIPFFAFGLGWEILGQSITSTSSEVIRGIGIFPTKSVRVDQRASCESYGVDRFGNLTAGYSNHSSEIEIFDGDPLVTLAVGFGNSSVKPAAQLTGEGFVLGNLRAMRLNGPALALNPHLADEFLSEVCNQLGFSYEQNHADAKMADAYALRAREELKARLAR